MNSRWLTWILAGEVVVLVVGGGWLVWRQFSPRLTARAAPVAEPSETISIPSAAVERGERGLTRRPSDPPPPTDGASGPSARSGPESAAGAQPGVTRPVTRRVPLGRLERPRIVVEKSAGRLHVYDGASRVRTYECIVGENRGDKVREGDMRTPEGDFYVCIRKEAPATPHVRSLGLSYPNAEDAERGLREGWIDTARHAAILEAIERGVRPPWDTPLGGAIMIHGRKDDREGTEGCVALDDADILELYPRIPLGTPVRIVP